MDDVASNSSMNAALFANDGEVSVANTTGNESKGRQSDIGDAKNGIDNVARGIGNVKPDMGKKRKEPDASSSSSSSSSSSRPLSPISRLLEHVEREGEKREREERERKRVVQRGEAEQRVAEKEKGKGEKEEREAKRRKKTSVAIGFSIDKDNTCCICCGPFSPPIVQCKRGHAYCEPCADRVKSSECPQCRVDFRKERRSRNLILENLLADQPRTCRKNCNASMPFRDLLKHEQSCQGSMYCYLCKRFSGSVFELHTHLKAKHGAKDFVMRNRKNYNFTWTVPKRKLRWETKSVAVLTTENGDPLYLLLRTPSNYYKTQTFQFFRIHHWSAEERARSDSFVTLSMGSRQCGIEISFTETECGLDINPHTSKNPPMNQLVLTAAHAHHMYKQMYGDRPRIGINIAFDTVVSISSDDDESDVESD